MEFKPRKYQEIAIDAIINIPYLALFLDMGLGKTVITLTAIQQLKELYLDANRVLVIAPKRVAETVWDGEIEKWDHLRGMTVSKVLGTLKQRKEALNKEADLYVINREQVPWLVNYYGKKWPFDTVIIDELSSFKSSKSQRFRALRKVRPFMDRVIGLTGTPAPNGLKDLWAQIYLLDQGERLGKTYEGFRTRYLMPDRYFETPSGRKHTWKVKPEAEQQIYKKISDICISMKAEDWIELPDLIDNVVHVKMSDEAWRLYQKLERDLLIEFDEGDVVAQTASVLSNKLLQMANGAVYDENGNIKEIHDAKLDALQEIVEEANGRPILVAYWYKHDLIRILERFPEARVLQSGKEVKDWNKGKIPVLLAHPASAGHGLNLQDGGNHIVWFGLTWSLELEQQFNARLYRQGQKQKVIIHRLACEGTLDEDVIERIKEKGEMQDALLNAVKARIRKVKGETLL